MKQFHYIVDSLRFIDPVAPIFISLPKSRELSGSDRFLNLRKCGEWVFFRFRALRKMNVYITFVHFESD